MIVLATVLIIISMVALVLVGALLENDNAPLTVWLGGVSIIFLILGIYLMVEGYTPKCIENKEVPVMQKVEKQ